MTLHQTTAYIPEANGFLECFHRFLKASLMSHSIDDSIWFTQIPLVLLGLKTTPKDTMHVSAAEMVYGDPVVIPAELFLSAKSSYNLHQVPHTDEKFIPCHNTYMPPAKQLIEKGLNTTTHVFMHTDSCKPPLTPLFIGPFLTIYHKPQVKAD
ncbi:uncharacterized protein [Palaemon carinicauda]|uniref:uncharacterized protein n=1 Tax=Palaemon carinicauda TaxID=392227 RepID=UPI0035B59C29